MVIAPLSVASLVAISRTMDYRRAYSNRFFHLFTKYVVDHWHDVVAGSLLGLVLAYFAYKQYYPGLAHREAHVPYTTRFEEPLGNGIDPGLPIYRDTEADVEIGSGEESVGLLGGSRRPNWQS